MSDTSLLFNFLKGRDTASPHMKTVAANADTMASRIRIGSVISVAATATMVAGFLALGAQGVALVSALAPLVGLLALLPALALGAAAGVATLLIGFHGLGAAMKRTAGGASGAADAIAAAERRVEMAQRSATQAQIDLNDARLTAAERLASITRELNRAHLDERGAILAVSDAQRTLREARRSGDRSAVTHAQLGYDESIQSLAEIRARLADVTTEEAKRTKAGVEGSDEVQTALQRQADAVRNLADAQRALATAGGSGGVDKAAQAYAKLSTAGKQLVDVLHGLGPAWATVQRAVQQSTLAGVAGDVRRLATAEFPVLQTQLSAIGKGWNLAFRGTAQLAASKGFVTDTNNALGNMATFWQRVGRSFAPFLSGFRHFTVVGSTFLPGIGGWILRLGQRFDAWAEAARRTGRAHDWIQNALTVLSQTWDVLKHLGSAIVGIFKAGSGGPNWMPGLVAGTKALSDWINSPAGQGKLAAVFTTLRDIGSKLWEALTHIGPALLDLFSASGPAVDTLSVFGTVIGFAADHLDDLAKWLPVIIGLFIAYKAAMAAAVVIEALRLPIIVASTVSNFALAGAMRANTAAILGNEVAQKRGIIATTAMKGAQIVAAVGTGIWTAAQWALNIALSPVGLIVIAIVAAVALLVGIIYLIATRTTWFQTIWRVAWGGVKAAFWAVVDWVADKVLWLMGITGRIRAGIIAGAKGMWDGMVHAFKAAVNWLIRIWNDFHLTLGGGSILGVDIPSVTLNTPDIPLLAAGGTAVRAGAAIVGDAGPELLNLPRGATVTPLPRAAGRQEVHVVLHLQGTDEEMKRMVRKMFRSNGGIVTFA